MHRIRSRRAVVTIAASALLACASSAAHARPQLGGFEEVEPNNTLASANFIRTADANVKHAIGTLTPGDVDMFKVAVGSLFDPGAGNAFVVVTTPLDGPGLSHASPDTIVEVYDHTNALIAADDDSGSDYPAAAVRGSVVRFITTGTGDYTIAVRGFDASVQGRYLLTIAQVDMANQDIGSAYADSLDGAAPPATPESINTRLNPSLLGYGLFGTVNDLDHLAIDLDKGSQLLITVCTGQGIASNTWNDINPTLAILDTDGSTVLVTNTNDAAGQAPGGSNSGVGCTIRFRAPAAGRYFARIQGAAQSGFYSIVTSVLPAPPPCTGDANSDGVVNFTDITTVLANFGAMCN